MKVQFSNIIRLTIAFLAVMYMAGFLVLASLRTTYPFQLEWIEQGCLQEIDRIGDNLPVYTPPKLEYVPLIYPPGYFYLSAVLMKFLGPGYIAPRLLSILASMMNFGLIYCITRRIDCSKYYALTSSGLFAATYSLSGYWFDLCRVDSLFMTFLLSSILMMTRTSLWSVLFAAIMISCAFWVKQTALIFVVSSGLFYVLLNKKQALVYTLTALILIGGISVLYSKYTDGWFFYYVFELPFDQQMTYPMIRVFIIEDLIQSIPFILILLFFGFFVSRRTVIPDRRTRLLLYISGSGLFFISCLSRLHFGGFLNDLMPLHSFAALLTGFYLARMESKPELKKWRFFSESILLFQLLFLMYNPFHQLPSDRDTAAGRLCVETIQQIDGPVYVPNHPYLAETAGKPRFAHQAAVLDVFRGRDCPAKADLVEQIKASIKTKKFTAIILDSDIRTWVWRGQSDYELLGSIPYRCDCFFTLTGDRTRPEKVYMPH